MIGGDGGRALKSISSNCNHLQLASITSRGCYYMTFHHCKYIPPYLYCSMYFNLFFPLLYFFVLFSVERVYAQQLDMFISENVTWKLFGMLVTDMFLLLMTEIT